MLQNRGLALIVLGIAGAGLLAAADSPPAPPIAKPSTQPRLLPNGSIAAVISKQTTRFTGPLNADGTLNYVAALDEVARQGVTKDNNFAAVVLGVYGPAALPPSIHDELLKRLELTLPDKGDYFPSIKDAGITDGEFDAATTQPWREEEHPKVARWLQANQKHLDRLAEGAKRCTHHYYPLLSPDAPPQFISAVVPNLNLVKRTANTLKCRALLRGGSGDVAGAQADIDAIAHLGRRAAQQPMTVSWLVGIACEALADRTYRTLALSGRLSAAQARAMGADVERWPPRLRLARVLDVCERPTGPDVIMMVERGQGFWSILTYITGSVQAVSTGGPQPAGIGPDPEDRQAIVDFNPVLVEWHAQVDRLVAACAQTPFAVRRKAVDEWKKDMEEMRQSPEYTAITSPAFWNEYAHLNVEGKRQKMTPVVAKVLPGMLLSSMSVLVNVEDKCNIDFDLTRVALALAAYHADKGEYPEKLESLAPGYIKTVPQDFFVDRPLHYQREGKGYLLYSVDVDLKDDGGDEKKDMVIRAR